MIRVKRTVQLRQAFPQEIAGRHQDPQRHPGDGSPFGALKLTLGVGTGVGVFVGHHGGRVRMPSQPGSGVFVGCFLVVGRQRLDSVVHTSSPRFLKKGGHPAIAFAVGILSQESHRQFLHLSRWRRHVRGLRLQNGSYFGRMRMNPLAHPLLARPQFLLKDRRILIALAVTGKNKRFLLGVSQRLRLSKRMHRSHSP